MIDYEPRIHLPEEWAKKAACPVCQGRGLTVSHPDGRPDRMNCPSCQVVFEIALDFTHLRLVRLPNQFIALRLDLIGSWVNPGELRTIVEQNMATTLIPEAPIPALASQPSPQPPAAPPIPPKLSQAEATQRAINLFGLGNSLETIRDVLERAGAAPEQVTLALGEITHRAKEKESRQTKFFYITTAVVGVLILGLIIWLAWVSQNKPQTSERPQQPTATELYFFLPDLSGKTTPTSAMSTDAQAYFKVLSGLQGDYLQRAETLKNANPPDELKDIHAQLVAAYTRAGTAKNNAEICQVTVAACNATLPAAGQTTGCKKSVSACPGVVADSKNAYTALKLLVTDQGCKAWMAYFSKMNEPWSQITNQGMCRTP